MEKGRVLFLCTGNSCRSQMAEALVNARLGESWEAFSAGSKPAGTVHPMAVKVLAEMGIDHRGRSKPMDEFYRQSFDLVITLCAEAEDECPVWLGKGRQVHLPFPDPAKMSGSDAEVISAFRSVRDEIVEKVFELLTNYKL